MYNKDLADLVGVSQPQTFFCAFFYVWGLEKGALTNEKCIYNE